MRRPVVSVTFAAAALAATCLASAQDPPAGSHAEHQGMHSTPHELHAAGPTVSFTELQSTVEQLNRAHAATGKYRDVRAARADGYQAIGPYVTGMGYHYVGSGPPDRGFDIDHPPILLYEKDATAVEGLRLVGVSYLFNAPAGPDGQPVGSPFPPALAKWHKHGNLCVMPDRSVETRLDAEECARRGGRFSAETRWMIHAWIWKDSPAGVFSPLNPSVR